MESQTGKPDTTPKGLAAKGSLLSRRQQSSSGNDKAQRAIEVSPRPADLPLKESKKESHISVSVDLGKSWNLRFGSISMTSKILSIFAEKSG